MDGGRGARKVLSEIGVDVYDWRIRKRFFIRLIFLPPFRGGFLFG